MEGGQGGASCFPAPPGIPAAKNDKAEASGHNTKCLYEVYNPVCTCMEQGHKEQRPKTHVKSNKIIL